MTGQETTADWYSERNATFGDRLAAARDAAGMTEKDLAKRLGVKLSTLRAWEDDVAEPRANKLSMLSGLLAVSLPWLLTGQGDGLDPPAEVAPMPEGATELLAELRGLRADAARVADRLGVLEKRLRSVLRDPA